MISPPMYQYNQNSGHLLHQTLTPGNNLSNVSNFGAPVASISDASLFHFQNNQKKQELSQGQQQRQ